MRHGLGGIHNPEPYFDPATKKWRIRWPGASLEDPNLIFETEVEARSWCENAIRMWEK